MHEDFSAELKSTREESGLTIQDIFESTRININFLEAIESGRFDILPDVYIRLFLRKYGQEIGLDPDDILRRYESAGGRLPRIPAPVAPPRPSAPADEAIRDAGETPDEAPPVPSRAGMRPRASSRPTSRAFTVAGIAGGALAIAAVAFVSSRPDTPPPAPSAGSAEAPAAPARDRSYRVTIPNADAHGDSISLEVSAVARASVSLAIDGESEFQRTVTIGDHFVWNAGSRFVMEIDRADALEIVLQGWRLPLNAKPESRLKLFVSPASVWVEEIQSPVASDDSF